MFSICLILLYLFDHVNGNVFLHSFRGSNNRVDEVNRDRNNGNRLFDSQNNDRGGYNLGFNSLSYYIDEIVPIIWSNQHGSGNYQVSSTEFIIQYGCDRRLRDGDTTNRIPINRYQCADSNCDTDYEYGRHEPYKDYIYCYSSQRNKGLFTANQNLNNRHAAIYTRQNPGTTRRGYECPEERDYYPYWRPSMWRDIAIITSDISKCQYYKNNSRNTNSIYACAFSDKFYENVTNSYTSYQAVLPITEQECLQSGYEWKEYPSWGISAPDCIETENTRPNHLGTIGGNRNYYTYNWKIENNTDTINIIQNKEECVLRIRYNITTNDYPVDEVTAANNSLVSNPDPDEDPAWIKIWEDYDLTYEDIEASFDGNRDGNPQQKSRGYVFINNPRIDPFGHLFNLSDGTGVRIQLQLAINTNQFGRTFEDRSHAFKFSSKPDNIGQNETLYLLSINGKRGNNVQVFPGLMYEFIPDPLTVEQGDWIHFCWTGSDNNPNNNDGQGDQGSDRSNICPLTSPQYSKDLYSNIDGNVDEQESGSVGDLGNNYFDYLEDPCDGIPEYEIYEQKRNVTKSLMAGFEQDIINLLCFPNDDSTGCSLDRTSGTFCIDPVQAKDIGIWNFLSTRNNEFGIRTQKGTIQVIEDVIVDDSVDNSVDNSVDDVVTSTEEPKEENGVNIIKCCHVVVIGVIFIIFLWY